MSILPIRPTASSADDALPQTLIDRVIARVNDAGESVDRRASATRPRASRRRSTLDPLSADMTRTPEQLREARSLRRVFEDLGTAYRRYRKETGAPVSPAVRDAAKRFRKELSVLSLASVAGRLDELKILNW
jgi:hypothetical protein